MGIYLREAAMADAEMILQWRNDEVTRANSFSKGEISPETHLKWMEARLADEACAMYIMMDGECCVGQLRIDRVKDVGEISYMIAPDKRKMGYGKKIITLAQGVAGKNVRALVGLVEKANVPSAKCFQANGYAELVGGTELCYIKTLM